MSCRETARSTRRHFVDAHQLRLAVLAWHSARDLSAGHPDRWHEHAQRVLERLDIDAKPTTLLSRLRPSAQTMIAIGRALQTSVMMPTAGCRPIPETECS